jgi:hypothetical protein
MKSVLKLFPLAAALCAVAVSSLHAASLTVTWTYTHTTETGFKVQRAPGSNPADSAFADVATVPYTSTNYIDAALPNGTTYSYRILAYNATTLSPWSNVATGTTPAALPAPGGATVAPTVLVAVTLNPNDSITVKNSTNASRPGSKTLNVSPGNSVLVASAP